jgi:hypothetical protein
MISSTLLRLLQSIRYFSFVPSVILDAIGRIRCGAEFVYCMTIDCLDKHCIIEVVTDILVEIVFTYDNPCPVAGMDPTISIWKRTVLSCIVLELVKSCHSGFGFWSRAAQLRHRVLLVVSNLVTKGAPGETLAINVVPSDKVVGW